MINIGIVGYGNLGKGIVRCLKYFPDIHLFAIFTRRNPEDIESEHRIEALSDITKFKEQIDVLILAGGSQKDIPEQAPALISHFNTVDVYDNHADISRYFHQMNQIALQNNTVSILSTGWDPGLFSLERTLFDAVLPNGNTYTFWGPGLSQGHSDAVRGIAGVKYGVQYTVPEKKIMAKARQGQAVDFSPYKAHRREVYIVLQDNANAAEVSARIKTIPDYFAPYDTAVHIISETEFKTKHQEMPHGGTIIRAGETAEERHAGIEFKLQLDSNPEFTASISLAYVRAVSRFLQEKNYGAKTVLDIPIAYLSGRNQDELLAHFI